MAESSRRQIGGQGPDSFRGPPSAASPTSLRGVESSRSADSLRHGADSAPFSDPERLLARVRGVLYGQDYQPPVLPSVALELLQLSRNLDAPLSKITSLIKTEPLIAAKVLRLAKSAYYSRGTPISSLDEAITRLGLRTLSDLFLKEAMTARVFKAPGYKEPMEAIRVHSTAVASLARVICKRQRLADEYAYMCGLLHDVGIAAALLITADVGRGQVLPAYEVIAPVVEEVHVEACSVLARAWELPEDVQQVLAHHHDFAVEGSIQPLAAAVGLADALIAEAGGTAGLEVPEGQAQRAAAELTLYDSELEPLRAEAVNQLAQSRG